jgi:RimJ/RimL family protein N-acetyltransferase
MAQGFDAYFAFIRGEQAAGRWMPFAVIQLSSPVYGGGGREANGGGANAQSSNTEAHRPLSHASHDSSPASGRANGVIVGQSCYLNIRPEHSGVEIGGTWYRPESQGTLINPASKLLLFGHAFDSGAERIDQKTDAINARSRRAMEKMGAKFEGFHRHAVRRPDGTWRDNAWYSVLREEWPEVKAGLEARLAAYR